MNDPNPARTYFQSPLWRWGDGGKTLESKNGKCIAFYDEVLGILERLEVEGLPPFHYIVCLFQCFRPCESIENFFDQGTFAFVGGSFDEQAIQDVQQFGFWKNMATGAVDCDARYFNDKLESIVNRLQELPAEISSSLSFKIELSEVAFSGLDNSKSIDESKRIMDYLRCGLGEEINVHPHLYDTQPEFGQFRKMIERLDSVDFESLAMRIETGVTQLPTPVVLELPEPQKSREFLKLAKMNSEFSAIASLAEDLMAAVTLPKRLQDFSDSEQGGFSDISNRGTPDRLLISELAYDDLTMAVRVAMKEAMYLRRETPPKNQRQQRIVILHNGIRTWGVQRLFAVSVALAVGATNEDVCEISTLRIENDRIEEADIFTEAGLSDQLKSFSTKLHPGSQLALVEQKLTENKIPSEPLFILAKSEFDDLDFQASLAASSIGKSLIVTVSDDGDLHLFAWDKSGINTIREAKCDLTKILAEPDVEHLVSDDHDELPAIFSLPRFPLRLFHAIKAEQFCKTDFGLLAISNDNRLMLWESRSKGQTVIAAIELLTALPSGTYQMLYDPFSQNAAIVCVKNQVATVVIVENSFSPPQVLELEQTSGVREYLFYRGALFGCSHRFFIRFNLETGAVSDMTSHGSRARHGRFFLNEEGIWNTIWLGGDETMVEELDIPVEYSSGILGIIESPSCDGQTVILHNGKIFQTTENKHLDLNCQYDFIKYSSDRCQVIISTLANFRGTNVHLNAAKPLDSCTKVIHRHLASEQSMECLYDFYADGPIRNKLRSVEITKSQQLVFKTKNGTRLVFRLQGGKLVLSRMASDEKLKTTRQFQYFETKEFGFGFRLYNATWEATEDSSQSFQVYLDTRGLVHFRSANVNIPEFTIVLKEGELSGWISTGEMFGNPIHCGDNSLIISDSEVYSRCIQPFVEGISDLITSLLSA